MAAGLVFVMTYFMNSLTDTILHNLLQPMAKTAAQDVEGHLHTLAERFLLIRENDALTSPGVNRYSKQKGLDHTVGGIEFMWLGVYETDGTLITGTAESPANIAGRDMWPLLLQTGRLVIEDTTLGKSGLEIAMGVPVNSLRLAGDGLRTESYISRYLVGSYKYDVLSDVLSNINIGEYGAAFIINESGTLIAHRNTQKVIDTNRS